MVGLYSGPPLDSLSERAAGLDIVPTTAGAVNAARFGEAFSGNLSNWLLRENTHPAYGATEGEPLYDPMGNVTGLQAPSTEAAPVMPAEEAQAKYGMPGLKFDHPVTEELAQARHAEAMASAKRQDIIRRSGGGVLASAPVGVAVSLAAGLLDPLNVAAAFVPVVGEARSAAMLARASGVLERGAVRAGIGAVEGGAGMAMLEPLEYLRERSEGNDWTMGEAMSRIAMGAVMGSLLHAGGGVIKDAVTGVPVRADSPLGETMRRVDALDPEAREAAFKGSVAAVAEGRPVDVAPVVRLAEARGGVVRAAEGRPDYSLLEFLARRGGVADVGGDLASMGLDQWHIGQPFMPRLIRSGEQDRGSALPGMADKSTATRGSLEDATQAAWEAGYFGARPGPEWAAQRGFGAEPPSVNDLKALMEREASGEKIYPPETAQFLADRRQTQLSAQEQEAFAGAREHARMVAEDAGIDLSPREIDHAATLMVRENIGPEEAVSEARHVSDMEMSADQDRIVEARESAQRLRDNAIAEPADQATLSADRQNREVLARAPKAEGPIDAQAAELQKLYAETRQRIEAEVAAGRLDPEALTALDAAEATARSLEGDARAYEATAACMVTRA